MFAGVMADEFFQIPTTEAKGCLKAAQKAIQHFSQVKEIHQTFSNWLVSTLDSLVEGAKKDTGVKKEKLWINYHKTTSSSEFASQWKDFSREIGVTMTPLFYQHITDEVFNFLLKDEFGLSKPTTVEDEQIPRLTYEEENAVYYVGGYILRALKKDPINVKILSIVDKLINPDKSDHASSTSQDWLKTIDRGGLTEITNEAFQCFYSMEIVVRKHFRVGNTRDMNTGFIDQVTTDILTDDDLLFNWCLAVGLNDDDIADICLKEIVKKWITIRGYSFANSMMEMYKQYSKKGTDKSKPLRSKLFTDNM